MTNTLSILKVKHILIGVAGIAAAAVFAIAASAEAGPNIATTIHTSAHSTTTEAAIGSLVHVHAAVATSTGSTTPTGTVDINRYEGTSCSGTATTQAGVSLVNGVAESSAVSVPAAGLSYRVRYNGDANNVPSEGSCTSLVATSNSASVSLALSTTTALVGSSVTGTATLSNVTSNATGTVTYTAYSNSSCNANAQGAGTKTVSNATVPTSNSVQFNSAGTYYWQAVYSGDDNNNAATSSCTNAQLNIVATSTGVGRIIVDKVTVPSGATTTFGFDVSGSGYSDFTLTDGSDPNNQLLTAGTYRIREESKSGWKLTSASCSKNGGSSTSYSQNSALSLGAGDTITCVFTNTKATTTGNGGGGNGNNGKHKGWVFGLPFGILKKVFNDVGMPPGIFKKFEERLDDEDLVDLKLKLREARELKVHLGGDDDDNDADKQERKAEKEKQKQERKEKKEKKHDNDD